MCESRGQFAVNRVKAYIDKYNVIRLIGVLMEHGFYDYCKQQDVMEMLEGDRENSYRCYLGKGIDDADLGREIRDILKGYKI